jgi:hypothetical protein
MPLAPLGDPEGPLTDATRLIDGIGRVRMAYSWISSHKATKQLQGATE